MPNAALSASLAAQRQGQGLRGSLAIGASSPANFSFGAVLGPASPSVPRAIADGPNATLYRWASVSKTLVGIVAAHLARQGVVDLDADVFAHGSYPQYARPTHYLACADGQPAASRWPGNSGKNVDCLRRVALPTGGANISLRLLLSHRAGIAHYENGERDPSPPTAEANDPAVNTGMGWALEKYLAPLALVAPPSAALYSYSTFGFNLAAQLLAEAAGESYASLVARLVAGPACLTTLTPDYEWLKLPHRAAGYAADGGDTGSDDVSWKLGGGGWVSSLQDVVRFGEALMATDPPSPAFPPEVKFDPGFGVWTARAADVVNATACARSAAGCAQYSMGWNALWLNGQLINAAHTGSQQKARTAVYLFPAARYAAFALSNAENANPAAVVGALEVAMRPQLPATSQQGCWISACTRSDETRRAP
jgi:CubicO group peptidase (beta-lactamase class C family)